MHSLSFSLRLVTPAFVAGAMERSIDPTVIGKLGLKEGTLPPRHRIVSETGDGLRIPSLRGLLRFWFRSKEGLTDRGDAVKRLAEREAAVFGSTEAGQGLRLIPGRIEEWRIDKVVGESGKAKSYLGYGPLNHRKDLGKSSSYNKSAFRDAILEGTRFHFRACGTAHQVDELERCLILLHLFGGIGGRSRRAWGSLAVEGDFMSELLATAPNVDAAFRVLLARVWRGRALPTETPARAASLPCFSAFSGATEIWRTPRLQSGYPEAFETFFRRFQETRLWMGVNKLPAPIAKTDHALELADATGASGALSGVPERLAFGLPYHPTSRSGWHIEYEGRGQEKIKRRASPLLLKVADFGPLGLYGVALWLKAEFFGDPAAQVGAVKRAGTFPAPGGHAIEVFLRGLPVPVPTPSPGPAPGGPPAKLSRLQQQKEVERRLNQGVASRGRPATSQPISAASAPWTQVPFIP